MIKCTAWSSGIGPTQDFYIRAFILLYFLLRSLSALYSSHSNKDTLQRSYLLKMNKALLSRARNIENRIGRFFNRPYFLITILSQVISIILQALLLAGCFSTSSFGKSVYISSFRYQQVPATAVSPGWQNITRILEQTTRDSSFQVRANYFGLCATTGSDSWVCATSPERLTAKLPNLVAEDPLGLAALAGRYRSEVLFPGLIIGSIVVAVLVIILISRFPGWQIKVDPDTGEEFKVKPFPPKDSLHACQSLCALSAAFALISALWQHTSAATATTLAEAAAGGAVKATIGSAAVALVWLSFGLLVLATAGLAALTMSLSAVKRAYSEYTW